MSSGSLRRAGVPFAGLTFWLLAATPGSAQPAAATDAAPATDEVARLRDELGALKRDYAARLAALEARLGQLEAQAGRAAVGPQAAGAPESAAPPEAGASEAAAAAPAEAAPSAAAPSPAPAAGLAEGGAAALPVYGGASAASKVFNPDIGVIGDFVGALGRTPGGGEPALEMHESELSFQAVVDPYARADFYFTVSPDAVGLEEGYLSFPTLPGGLLLKIGRLRDAFGKVDAQHNHVLPFVDRPLVSKNLLGGEDALADSGVSVSRLLPNPWLFLEATAQVFRGESEVFKAPTRADLAYVGHLRAYRDLGESTNLDLGGSLAYGHNGVGPETTTRLLGADLTLRYRPLRRSIYTSFIARGELVWSRRQDLVGSPTAFGAYGHLEYQFARRFSAGVRLDSSERADASELRDRGGSLLLTFRPSEFSQLRTQLRRTRFGEGRTENELLFQLVYAIGAHGAHPF